MIVITLSNYNNAIQINILSWIQMIKNYYITTKTTTTTTRTTTFFSQKWSQGGDCQSQSQIRRRKSCSFAITSNKLAFYCNVVFPKHNPFDLLVNGQHQLHHLVRVLHQQVLDGRPGMNFNNLIWWLLPKSLNRYETQFVWIKLLYCYHSNQWFSTGVPRHTRVSWDI